MSSLANAMRDYVNAGFSGIWVQTSEPDEAQKDIASAAKGNSWRVIAWDIANGIHGTPEGAGDPIAPIRALSAMTSKGNDSTLLLLHNYHRFLANPEAMQTVFSAIQEGKANRTFLVVLAPTVSIPAELEKLFVVIDHELPDKAALAKIAGELDSNGASDTALEAAAGLTRYEAEGAFALSLARHNEIRAEEVWQLKAKALKKSGTLEMHKGNETFADIGGLNAIKQFCLRALRPGTAIKPRGIMLLGVPGVGKSALAKALGNETGRPMARAITGNLKTSGYGDSEQRMAQLLRTADAMAPCILFFDEVEKLLAGASRKGDPGATLSMLGVMMEWLNDHTSDVFTIMTCNAVDELPPAFSRAERFDGVFFLDTPADADRAIIWTMYRKQYAIDPADEQPTDDYWTGAEIKACCRLSALLGVKLVEAARNVIPVAISSAESIAELQQWADGRCIDAGRGGIYRRNPDPEVKPGRRAIQRGGSGAN